MGSKKYHDAEWLREKYHVERMTMREIADECGVTNTTISDWMDRHDIEKRNQREAQLPEGKHTDAEWLAEQYHVEGRTLTDIAGECDVDKVTVMNWMERHGIPRRSSGHHHRRQRATLSKDDRGYRFAHTRAPESADTKRDKVFIHQLLAIADGADPYKVFSDGAYHVHHKNGVKWDNRPENVELLTQREHNEIHAAERERAATGEWL